MLISENTATSDFINSFRLLLFFGFPDIQPVPVLMRHKVYNIYKMHNIPIRIVQEIKQCINITFLILNRQHNKKKKQMPIFNIKKADSYYEAEQFKNVW